MKRLGLVLAGLALAGAVNTADAQLTMQMSNGWSATFAGNVNAFYIYQTSRVDGTGDFAIDRQDERYRHRPAPGLLHVRGEG